MLGPSATAAGTFAAPGGGASVAVVPHQHHKMRSAANPGFMYATLRPGQRPGVAGGGGGAASAAGDAAAFLEFVPPPPPPMFEGPAPPPPPPPPPPQSGPGTEKKKRVSAV